MSNQELIDAALAAVRQICHRHDVEPITRLHLDRAAAHLREAWLAEDGGQARAVQMVAEQCEKFNQLMERLAASKRFDSGAGVG